MLVAVEPVRQVRNAVRDRVPGDPVGPLDGKLRAVDQTAGVRKPDRRGMVPLDLSGLGRSRKPARRRFAGGSGPAQERRLGDPGPGEVEPIRQARGILLERTGALPAAAVPEHVEREHRGRPENERDRRHRARGEPAPTRRLRRQPPLPRGCEPRRDRHERELQRVDGERRHLQRERPERPAAAARGTRARPCRTTPRRAASPWTIVLRREGRVSCGCRKEALREEGGRRCGMSLRTDRPGRGHSTPEGRYRAPALRHRREPLRHRRERGVFGERQLRAPVRGG